MALTGEADLDSENYNATKLKQTPINGVTCNDCKLKRSREIKVVVFPQRSTESTQFKNCDLLPSP